MYSYEWDPSTGGYILNSIPLKFSKEPRPVYYKELDMLGFDRYWNYEKDDAYPYMWAEANVYWYRGRKVAQTKGGSCYTAPELVLFEEPEPDGEKLQYVDISTMVKKNEGIMNGLVQDSIKKVYNTYMEYQNKVDVFYVAFSGGKDSVVALDIVQRALPHNAFKVLFGDTGMEFPDTYDVIDKTKEQCENNGIEFLTAKSHYTPDLTWESIGPPAQRMRWCCSVHKTAPQILLLRKITGNSRFHGMAMMGVRGDESISRSRYEEINLGTKHQGQYDFYPILNWNSAELFLYIYGQDLIINETYKRGNNRAGCLVCPMEADKSAWVRRQLYSGADDDMHTTTFYEKAIIDQTFAHELTESKKKEFMEKGVWKSRHNGSKLAKPRNLFHDEKKGSDYIAVLDFISADWREWMKTVGRLTFFSRDEFEIDYAGQIFKVEYSEESNKHIFKVVNIGNTKNEILFLSCFKIALKKSAYCIRCQVCEANCPYGFIHMDGEKFYIDDRCIKCRKCHNVNEGCVVVASQQLPKGANTKMGKSIDQYKTMGIRYEWVLEFLKKKDGFWEDNTLGSVMITTFKSFLSHAGITQKNKITPFGELIASIGGDSPIAWGLMLCNLAYTPEFNWWIKNIEFDRVYSAVELDEMLKETPNNSDHSRQNIASAFKNIFDSNPVLDKEIGFGHATIKARGKATFLIDVSRTSWRYPDPRVILYSLYKFAEACDGYYQFTLTRLLNHDIESSGVSPTEIFGIGREDMEKLINGLSVNYPDLIRCAFTIDLDNISLNSEKTSADVLKLF